MHAPSAPPRHAASPAQDPANRSAAEARLRGASEWQLVHEVQAARAFQAHFFDRLLLYRRGHPIRPASSDGSGKSVRFHDKLLLVPAGDLRVLVEAQPSLVRLGGLFAGFRPQSRSGSCPRAWEGTGPRELLHRQVPELPEECPLKVMQQNNATAGLACTSCAPEAVDVLIAVGGDADLNHGGHVREVHPSGADVRAEDDAAPRVPEEVAALGPVWLALFRVDLQDLHAGLLKERRVETGEARRGEEDHDLVLFRQALHLGVHRRPQQLGHPLRVRHGGVLLDLLRRDLLVLPHGVQPGVLGPDGQRGELLDGVREGRREEGALALLRRRQRPQDLEDGGAEAHVEEPVRLVEHHELQAPQALPEARRVVQVVQHPAGRCYEDVDRLFCKGRLVA
mmetsp:Transcript_69757/g.185367  ORF Transcript_69757/g.185367 Transcript_69757/m.185367 type:complete len:395 (+) Transcript_69757:170-1354(+)